jgi:hypothetical protein
MPFPKTFSVTCPCSKARKFYLAIEVEECAANEVHKTEQPCQYAHEPYCHGYISVTLPAGLQPDKDKVDRNMPPF